MSTADTNKAPALINPLQNNNAAMTAIGYLAGIAAAKLPIFDLMTWNYIFMSMGGMLVTIGPYILNRKSAVVATVANMPEVKTVELDKTVSGAKALEDVTPSNVTVSK
jgi:hypothetical protein